MPRAEDRVQIGYWSLEEGKFYPVAETRAYNWQQGAQLQWLPPDYSTRIVFNDREGDRFVSRIVNIEDGTSRALPFPIYTVHPAGTSAVCVNCERSYFRRPGYNYQGVGSQNGTCRCIRTTDSFASTWRPASARCT